MASLVEQAPAGGELAPDVLTKHGLDKPVITVNVGTGSATATLAFGKEEGEGGAVYARDLSRPMVFTVDATLLTDLKKSVDEYRDKNVFAFRSYNLDRLRIVRGTNAYEFIKVKATAANEPDKWQRTINGGAAADADTTKVEDLLTKLSNLRIESFVEKAPSQPEITVSASYDQGKFERVRLSKAGADALAAREGEPGAGRLDSTNYDETIKALDAVVAPAS
jgi:hypothetical protein